MPNRDLTRLPHKLDPGRATCRAIVETPRGSRAKFDYDPETGLFKQAGLLPEGMSFPLDFGFVPATLGEDGDPLDILVLNDEPAPVGCLLQVRLLGVIEAEQTEDGETKRNDRLIGVADPSIRHAQVKKVDELGPDFLRHLTQFWVNYNELKDKRFAVLGVGGPERAVVLIEAGAQEAADG